MYEHNLMKRTFRGLFKLKRFLADENRIILEQQHKIIQKFRMIKVGKQVFKVLRDYAQGTRVQRDKDMFKDQIRGKVT